jgi:hypothetical protein
MKAIIDSVIFLVFVGIASFVIVFGTGGYYLARSRGLSPHFGFALSAFTGFIGWILIVILAKVKSSGELGEARMAIKGASSTSNDAQSDTSRNESLTDSDGMEF